MSAPTERWRPVVGFEGLYEVSDLGRIRSHVGRQGKRRSVPRLLACYRPPIKDGRPGYATVTLRKDGRSTYRRVHVIVLEAFVGPRPEGHVGGHRDGNSANNALSNLGWITYVENANDAIRHGTIMAGETHYATKLDAESVVRIRERAAAGERYKDLAAEYGQAPNTISLIVTGRSWKHVGGPRCAPKKPFDLKAFRQKWLTERRALLAGGER